MSDGFKKISEGLNKKPASKSQIIKNYVRDTISFDKNDEMVLFSGSGVDDIADSLSLKDLKRYASYLQGDYFEVDHDSVTEMRSYTFEHAVSILEKFKEKDPTDFKKILDKVSDVLDGNNSKDEYDLTNPIELLGYTVKHHHYNDETDPLIDALNSAVGNGYEHGAQQDLYKAYKELIRDNNISQEYPDDKWEYKITFTDFVDALVTVYDYVDDIETSEDYEDFFELIDNDDIEDEVKTHLLNDDTFKDLDIPYYGFDGYDDKAAYESFTDRIYQDGFIK